jgi:Tol biopolymer transport system component/tRNA A-37 threonylcarbamoyl transferase component Bud32
VTLTTGSRIGAYDIVSALGAGGMGEVYRARDTKLNRDVALKVLLPEVAHDPERLARFRREAQILASLNHPNIAHIHGLEETDDVVALVMVLVDRTTLQEVIAKPGARGRPVDDTLNIAKQIAEALEAAHERGIVHRDLKPANIKVRDDGTVKVLDFGLAKAIEQASGTGDKGQGSASISPTITSPAQMTGVGIILGTAAYMAPEQARGRAVDKRADIWAFGVVLFEMVTGERLFKGEDITETLAAVVKDQPDFTTVPVQLRRLLHKCMEKDPNKRLRDIGDAWALIDQDGADAVHATTQQPPRGLATWAGWAAAAVFLAAAVGLGFMVSRASAPVPGAAVRFSPSLPDGWQLQASSEAVAISPDATTLAMVLVSDQQRTSALWIRSFDSTAPRMVPGTEAARGPFWSPDGRFIGFFAGGKLKKVDVAGGPPFVLCDAPSNLGGTWGRDGTIVFSTGKAALLKVSQAGGAPTAATREDEGLSQVRPVFLADGRHFYYWSGTAAAGKGYIGTLDSPDRTILFNNPEAANVAFSRGRVLFLHDRSLMAQPFDSHALAVTGEPVPVVDQISTGGIPVRGLFTASESGALIYGRSAAETRARLTWYDRSGKRLGSLGEPAGYADLALTPQSDTAAVSLPQSGAGLDIWLLDVRRGTRTRFTFDPSDDVAPAFSPDGSRVLFASGRKGHLDLYEKTTDGAGEEQVLLADDLDKMPHGVSPDGRFLIYQVAGLGTRNDLWVLPLFGDRKPFAFLHSPFSEVPAAFSPDGRWVAYGSDESGTRQLYVTPFPGARGKWQVSTDGVVQMRWNSNGRELFYMTADGTLMAASVDGQGSAFKVGPVTSLFKSGFVERRWSFDVTRDGQRFLILERADDAPSNGPPVNVVLNWPAALGK